VDGVRLKIANSAWVKGPVDVAYLSEIQAIFNADVKPLPSNPGPINEWVAQMTEFKIPKIVENLDSDDRVVLVNAIYFQGRWKTQFKKEATVEEDFQRLDGPVPCQMMSMDGEKMYYTEIDLSGSGNTWVQAVRLPYDNSAVSAVVVLPKAWGASAMCRLVSALSVQRWTVLSQGFAERHLALQLPKFTVDSGLLDMRDSLERIGIRTAWKQPSFPAMSAEPLYLSKVLHRAICEVNEEGTVAAAATSAVMSKGAGKSSHSIPIRMKVDRPFLFAIVHNLVAAPLFWGVVSSPAAQVGSLGGSAYPT